MAGTTGNFTPTVPLNLFPEKYLCNTNSNRTQKMFGVLCCLKPGLCAWPLSIDSMTFEKGWEAYPLGIRSCVTSLRRSVRTRFYKTIVTSSHPETFALH